MVNPVDGARKRSAFNGFIDKTLLVEPSNPQRQRKTAMKLIPILMTALTTTIGFGFAHAQQATPDDWLEAGSTRTRAEVRADAIGHVHHGEATRFGDAAAGLVKTRAQVSAEAREAARLGVLGGGELDARPTLRQLEQIAAAGLMAVESTPVARSQ